MHPLNPLTKLHTRIRGPGFCVKVYIEKTVPAGDSLKALELALKPFVEQCAPPRGEKEHAGVVVITCDGFGLGYFSSEGQLSYAMFIIEGGKVALIARKQTPAEQEVTTFETLAYSEEVLQRPTVKDLFPWSQRILCP